MLDVDKISKTYGTGPGAVQAIGELSFSVAEGEFVCLVGPSGAGKTTLLRCLSGLLPLTTGQARLDGQPVVAGAARLAVVFQDYARSLLPWFSVAQNVAFPLRGKLPEAEISRRVDWALGEVGLGHCPDRLPWQLSGGMQQRVAIARAVAFHPKVLLMDEPFASVDAQTRSDLEDLVLNIQRELGMTVLFVTHDIDEAVYLGDRVVVLTKAPSHIRAIVPIDLPRDRDQITTKDLSNFSHLRTHVLRLVKGEPVSSPESLTAVG